MASSTAISSLYEGCTLPHRHIRLLSLKAPRSIDDNLHGSLRTVSLDKNPHYEALSYTWGADSQEPQSQILCSGTSIPITLNCASALRTLWHRFHVRTIWIDAICINQNDNKEKGHQIPLMKEIYGKARRVFIWLGEGTALSDQAMEWMINENWKSNPYISIRLRSFPANMKPREMAKVVGLLPEYLSRKYFTKPDNLYYNHMAMQDLVTRDWFKRVWTIQELVMANEPLVVCGDKSIRWNYLSRSINSARNRPENENNDFFDDVWSSTTTAHSFWNYLYMKREFTKANVRTWLRGPGLMATIFHHFLDFLERFHYLDSLLQILIAAVIVTRICLGLRPLNSNFLLILILVTLITRTLTPQGAKVLPGQRPNWEYMFRATFFDMLNMLRARQATLPIDKVFALYGIFADFDIALQPPDYRKSVLEVYFEFTCSLMNWHGSLEVLLAAGPSMPGVPSWIPDWNQRKHRVFVEKMDATRGSTPYFKIITKHTSETQLQNFGSIPQEKPLPKLITRGMIVDHITYGASLMVPKSAPDAYSRNLTIFINLLRVSTGHSFYKVLYCDQYLTPEQEAQKRDTFNSFQGVLQRSENLNSPSISTSDVEKCLNELKEDKNSCNYFENLCTVLSGKRGLFTTSKGRIGSGMLGVREDDAVALLAGLSAPIILRKEENKEAYQVIGVAYVEGLMQSEWNWVEAETREIVLV